MVEVKFVVNAPAKQVFEVLADGWLYTNWVVGASHIRDVDAGWPEVGTRIHHSVGLWPMTIDDTTEVLAVDPPRLLELRARLWPVGMAAIRLELSGDETTTEIRMTEEITGGPGRMLPEAAQALMLAPRNTESLSRLADLVLGRAA
ncbi:SRPBCC family protein [Nocardia sp. XZ_19_385]|uniref:SRPBCC family protein n=1 Tax=Nocardia sp. XZ_19_385 TaxID=2769488 RepID=UPI00188FE8C6|nr:SRPBCC family protein [Nocardia sp. XZ_19_385]